MILLKGFEHSAPGISNSEYHILAYVLRLEPHTPLTVYRGSYASAATHALQRLHLQLHLRLGTLFNAHRRVVDGGKVPRYLSVSQLECEGRQKSGQDDLWKEGRERRQLASCCRQT